MARWEEFECVLCGEKFNEYGNNPYPLAEEGECCDSCNNDVIVARIEAMKEC
jgi:hypothetical protein